MSGQEIIIIQMKNKNHGNESLMKDNSAAGSTGSQFALFRAQTDIIERDCDLIFIEYAVNDSIVSPELRMRSWEGLVRKIRSATTADIVIVYTFMQTMYADMIDGKMPPSIEEFD